MKMDEQLLGRLLGVQVGRRVGLERVAQGSALGQVLGHEAVDRGVDHPARRVVLAQGQVLERAHVRQRHDPARPRRRRRSNDASS